MIYGCVLLPEYQSSDMPSYQCTELSTVFPPLHDSKSALGEEECVYFQPLELADTWPGAVWILNDCVTSELDSIIIAVVTTPTPTQCVLAHKLLLIFMEEDAGVSAFSAFAGCGFPLTRRLSTSEKKNRKKERMMKKGRLREKELTSFFPQRLQKTDLKTMALKKETTDVGQLWVKKV